MRSTGSALLRGMSCRCFVGRPPISFLCCVSPPASLALQHSIAKSRYRCDCALYIANRLLVPLLLYHGRPPAARCCLLSTVMQAQLSFLSCREQLNRLAALGAHYAALEAFVEATGGSNLGGLDGGGAAPLSLYRLALSNGISELLDVFRSAVLRVEAHLLHLATPLPLLTVQHFLLEVRWSCGCCCSVRLMQFAEPRSS